MEESGLPSSTLHRTLSPFEVMLLTFSALSPAMSVYIAGAGVLHIAGTGAALAFIIGGFVPALLALLYAELGSAFPRAGGTYPSIAAILGPTGAFPLVAINMFIGPAVIAFSALGLADYARVLAPGLPLLPLATGAIVLATAIAVLRVRTGAWVTGFFLAVEVLALLLLTGVALAHPTRSLLEVFVHPMMLDHSVLKPAPVVALALGLISGAWACSGASFALYFGEEMKDAPHNMGKVVARIGFIASLIIAAPMVLLVLSIRDLSAVLAAEAPIAVFLQSAGGPVVAMVVSIGVLAAIFNSLIALAMSYGRFLYSTGRDGVWPRPASRLFARLNPRTRSPIIATVLVGLATIGAALMGERALLVFLSGNVVGDVLIALAVLVGRHRGLTGRVFRAPLHPAVPAFGLLVAAVTMIADWQDVDAGRPSVILLTTIFFLALGYYRFHGRRRRPEWAAGVAESLESTAS